MFFDSLINIDAHGNWSLNTGVFDIIASEIQTDSKLTLLKRVQVFISQYMKKDTGKEEDKNE